MNISREVLNTGRVSFLSGKDLGFGISVGDVEVDHAYPYQAYALGHFALKPRAVTAKL